MTERRAALGGRFDGKVAFLTGAPPRNTASSEMMRRFTGDTDEGRAVVIAQEPIGLMGKPEEVAAAVLWLCSDEAAFTVGHARVGDGGQTA